MTLCACGESTIDLEGHLLRAHPALAARGTCSVCGQVVSVGHCSDAGPVLEEHPNDASLIQGDAARVTCPGSGTAPRRNLVLL